MIFGKLEEYCADCKDNESLTLRIMDYLGMTGYEVSEDDAEFIESNGYGLAELDGECQGDEVTVVLNKEGVKRYFIACDHNLQLMGQQKIGNYEIEDMQELLNADSMEDYNYALKGFGVESVKSISGENDFEYVNMGDGYNLTIVRYKGEYLITTWADIVEDNMEDFE